MKGDTGSSCSESEFGPASQPPAVVAGTSSVPQGTSTKIQNEQARAYSLDEQAPPGYEAVEPQPDYGVRQPLISGNETGTAVEVQNPLPVGPRQLDADFIIDLLLFVVALAVPPAAVIVKQGCGGHFWINVVLTMFGGFPGLIHAWYIIAVTPGTIRNQAAREARENEDVEQGNQGGRIELLGSSQLAYSTEGREESRG